MAGTIQAVRGMNDIGPQQTAFWQYLEETLRRVIHAYGYREIRLPLLEKTELFKRSIGEVTDIVEKEMYTFDDRNGDSLTLRPEGTAAACAPAWNTVCCTIRSSDSGMPGRCSARASRERALSPVPSVRRRGLRDGGPRYRRGNDLHDGADVAGVGPEGAELQINSLGTQSSRAAYWEALVDYFRGCLSDLDVDSRRRLDGNPLRILDSKNPQMQAVIGGAPRLPDYLDAGSRAHFDALRDLLNEAGIDYAVNPRLVRGLDYYGKTVFEWVTDRLGAQGTICAGGRYDGLVEYLGGRATPAVGFALGLERLSPSRSPGLAPPDGNPHAISC